MPDDADMAQAFEAEHRDSSLHRLPRISGPPPVFVDGVACCAECEDPIPPARLKALPGVGLCVACMSSMEEEKVEVDEPDEL